MLLCLVLVVGSFVVRHRLPSGVAWALEPAGSAVAALLSRATWDLSSPTRDWTCIPCIVRRILNYWTTQQVPRWEFLMCCAVVMCSGLSVELGAGKGVLLFGFWRWETPLTR